MAKATKKATKKVKKVHKKITTKDLKKPPKLTKDKTKVDKRGRTPASLANLKPFPKGVSGNPNGAPKGRYVKSLIRDILEYEVSHATLETGDPVETQTRKNLLKELELKMGRKLKNNELMVFQVMGRALKYGDVSAFNALMDRLEGKPVQHNINENQTVGYWDILGVMANGEKTE